MKIMKFTGGLGNQMFQTAFSLLLQKNGYEVLSDTDLYKARHFRGGIDMNHGGFEIERVFGIHFDEATDKQVTKLGTRADTLVHRIHRKFFTKKSHVIEYSSEYHPKLLTDCRDQYLEGYWQNPKYFSGNEEFLRKAFSFKLPLSEKSQELKNRIEEINKKGTTVSIHVRRGDYLNSRELFVCGKKYFDGAVNKLFEEVKAVDSFIVFSDDIAWCRENLDLRGAPAVFVDWNHGQSSWEDIALMSLCSHNIIPNSSFSFWGAWLNANPAKKVIAPEIWNISGFAEVNDKDWILVPAGQ